MAWWNPASWGKGVGEAVTQGVLDALDEIGDKVIENPEIIVVPVSVAALAIMCGAAAQATGTALGPTIAEEIIDTTEEML